MSNAKYATFTIVMLDIFLASFPLFEGALPQGHDTLFHLFRIEGIAEGLKEGQFPVRIQTSQLNGYGYPVSIMYGDFFLYLPALLTFIGLSVITSYKCFVFTVNVLTILLTYSLTRRITNSKKISILAATLWGLAPYRLEDIYLRGAVGEYLSLLFFPLIVYGLYVILVDPENNKFSDAWLILTLGMTGIVVSHVISVLLFSIAALPIVICCLFSHNFIVKIRLLVRSILCTFLLCIFFIVPFIDFYNNANLQIRHIPPSSQRSFIADYTVEPLQLFTLFQPMEGLSTTRSSGISNEMPYSIGWAIIICFIIWLLYYFETHTKPTRFEVSSAISLCFLLFLIAPGYFNFWNKDLGNVLNSLIVKVSSIQYSWRFIGPASFLFITLGIFGIARLNSSLQVQNAHFLTSILSISLMSLCFLEAGVAMTTTVETAQSINSFSAQDNKTSNYGVSGGEYLPYKTDIRKLSHQGPFTNAADIQLSGFQRHGTTLSTHVQSGENSGSVSLPLLYYPHYQAKGINGIYKIRKGPNNVIEVLIPPRTNDTIVISFTQPWTWIASSGVSLSAILILCFILCYSKITRATPGARHLRVRTSG